MCIHHDHGLLGKLIENQCHISRSKGNIKVGDQHFDGAGVSTIGKESVPIQLAQRWFPGLAISKTKI